MSAGAITDWANLPPGVQALCLWESVHDGELHRIESYLLARTLTIHFAVSYLLSFHKLPDDLMFAFSLQGVESVRALRYSVWPGKFTIPSGIPWEAQQKLISENRRKWRQQSESWDNFEHAVAADDETELTDGDLVRGADGRVALRLGVQMGSGEWYDVFFRAQGLMIRRSDQQQLVLEEFVELGRAYWGAFAQKRLRDEQNH